MGRWFPGFRTGTPGRLERAARRTVTAAAKETVPYAASLAAVLAAALVLRQSAIALLGAGAVLGAAGVRLHEARGWHRSGGKAAMRRRRKYQGTATRRELARNLSPQAAARKSRALFPELPPSQAAIPLGRFKGQDVAGSRADSYLVIAPPQSLKTALVSCWAEDAPGALLAFSSRCDQYRHTAVTRSRLGDVLVLNADGDGGIPSSFTWSPADGCEDPRTAIRRAGDLMAASPRDATGKDAWHEDRGAKLIRYMLHAAALDGASMREVAAWVHDPLSAEPAAVLEAKGHPGWAARLAALLDCGDDARGGLVSSAAAALGWMDDPAMAAAACPPGEGFDPRAFLEDGTGSVYLIGADRPHGSLAPYFAAFGAEMFEAARSAAEDAGGRLPVPFTIIADEAAVICPLPFHRMTAVSAGYGITIAAVVQADSQITGRWGEHDGATMRTNFTVKVIGPGFTNPGELERLSVMCGEQDTWHHVRHPDGSRTRQPGSQRLYPPERVRLLKDWHALVIHRNTRVAEVTVTPVWDRPGYQRAPAPPAAPLPERLAIEAPRREAILVPGGRPAVPAPGPVPELASPAGAAAVPGYTPAEEVPCSVPASA